MWNFILVYVALLLPLSLSLSLSLFFYLSISQGWEKLFWIICEISSFSMVMQNMAKKIGSKWYATTKQQQNNKLFLPVHHQVNLLKRAAKQSPVWKKFPLSISSVQPWNKVNTNLLTAVDIFQTVSTMENNIVLPCKLSPSFLYKAWLQLEAQWCKQSTFIYTDWSNSLLK